MYQKPVVRRFGTFRDITQVGGDTRPTDGFSVYGSTSAPTIATATPVAVSRS